MRPSILSHTTPAFHLRTTSSLGCAPISRRGFTAVEVLAVATIIAVLAMLLIPMMRGYVETAKKRSCVDEMNQISKCIDISYAENNSHYFRLQDLDNNNKYVSTYTTPPADNRTTDCPFGYLGTTVTLVGTPAYLYYVPYDESTRKTSSNGLDLAWKGPYSRVQKAAAINDLFVSRGTMLTQLDGGSRSVSAGTILPCAVGPNTPSIGANMTGAAGGPIIYSTLADEGADLYPLDPWGNPYIFLPYVDAFGGRPGIFSMGPDGMPGNLTGTLTPTNYYPSSPLGSVVEPLVIPALSQPLGTGDDLYLKM